MSKYRIMCNYDTLTYDVEMVSGNNIITVAECNTEEDAHKILNYYKEKYNEEHNRDSGKSNRLFDGRR